MAIKEYYIENKKRNLDIEAKGNVKSTKYFPVFVEDNREKIFKPLSKTKPYSTPLFAYSEMYWSYFMNKYINRNTPIYHIAICHGLSDEQPKYYDKGTVVRNVLKKDEKFINILEIFKKYPEEKVNISDYVNYCEMQYDYEKILRSKFFTKHKDLGEALAKQILCSILRRDDNYHYENVNFIEKDNKIIGIAPIIDQEFSQMFMFIDDEEEHIRKFNLYDKGMGPDFEYNDDLSFDENLEEFVNKLNKGSVRDIFDAHQNYNVGKNIKVITELYPAMCEEFKEKLQEMKKEVSNSKITFDNSFLGMFSSKDWKPTRMLYKDGFTEKDNEYLKAKEESESSKIRLNTPEFNKKLRKEVVWSIDKLTYMIDFYLNVHKAKTSVILSYNNDTLYKIDETEKSEEEKIVEDFIKKLTKDNKY